MPDRWELIMKMKEITCREIRFSQEEPVEHIAEENQHDSRLNIKIMLEISENDFATERERKKNFETRAGAFFGFIGTALVFILNLKHDTLRACVLNIQNSEKFILCLSSLTLVILFAASVCCIVKACKNLIDVLGKMNEYRQVDISYLYGLLKKNVGQEEFIANLIMYYKNAVQFNRNLNDKKADLLSRSTKDLLYSIYCLVAYLIIYLLSGI